MKRLPLVRRRELWVPTLWGWLAILFFVTAISILVARNLYPFLSPTDPAGARLLVIEGWLEPPELDQAIVAFRASRYERVVTTGGPTMRWPDDSNHRTYAELAADYLQQNGLSSVTVMPVSAPYTSVDHTFVSAVAVREWAHREGIGIASIDVLSDGPHTRRSRLLYQWAFGPGVKIGSIAAVSADYDPVIWWRSSAGIRDVLVQAGGWVRVRCCFFPPSREDQVR